MTFALPGRWIYPQITNLPNEATMCSPRKSLYKLRRRNPTRLESSIAWLFFASAVPEEPVQLEGVRDE